MRALPATFAADPTLRDPRCVYQVLKRHFARYTPEMVERVCGVPPETFLQVARAWTETPAGSAPPRWSTASAGPSTGGRAVHPRRRDHPAAAGQHRPPGRRDLRAAGPRQHSGIDRHPDPVQPAARLSADAADTTHGDLAATWTPWPPTKQKGFWRNADTYFVSLLKEYWGDAATADNDYCFDYLPRINGTTAPTAP